MQRPSTRPTSLTFCSKLASAPLPGPHFIRTVPPEDERKPFFFFFFLFPFRSIIGSQFSKQRDGERCREKDREGKGGAATDSLTYSRFMSMANFRFFPICKSFHTQPASVRLGEPVLGTPTVLVPAEYFSPGAAAWDHLLVAWFGYWFGEWGANGG